MTRLTAAGVSVDVIATIKTEITDAEAAGEPLTVDQIRERLVELGVDVTKVFAPRDNSLHEEFLSRLGKKLSEAGVSEEVITTISEEVTAAETSGNPLTIDQIKTRLIELGVDISKVFPPRDNPHDGFLTGLTARLTRAGVSQEVITTISEEVTAAVKAGTPLTIEQIKTRLTELGVDVSKVFPPNGNPGDDFLTKLTSKLAEAGVSEEVITTISEEVTAAVTAGTPLTIEQIKTRLTELGVDVSKVFPPRDNPSDGF